MGAAACSLAIADGLLVGRAAFVAPPARAADFYDRFTRHLGLSPAVDRATRRRIEDRLLTSLARLDAERLGREVRVPVLVVHDRDDREVPWLDGAIVADACPDARLYTTQGLGHRRILRDPEGVAAVVRFLGGEVREAARCSRCERPVGRGAAARGELCEQCSLEAELYDRSERWARLAS